jgi:energy-coupling factor transporter ATP-binding protein EcfA2
MPGLSVQRIPQDVFAARYFVARPGEHVALIGPTGRGKTTLAMRLMMPALMQNPGTRGVILAMKPHRRDRKRTGDETVARMAKADGARVIRDWPPPNPWRPPPYWVLWPKHAFDPRIDDPAHYAVFRRAILDCYKRGGWWIFADEVYSLTHELGLGDELVTLWTKGRSMGTAVIGATQKPTHVPTWMYSQSSHLFLWYDGDLRARKRYAEISGFDPRLIAQIVGSLRGHDCLYVCPGDNTLCIVTATESARSPAKH